MSDQDDQRLFARGVRHALTGQSSAAADAGLAELGWVDALAEWGGAAIEAVFTEQGRLNASSTALDDVLGLGLGLAHPLPVLLPAVGGAEAAAALVGSHLRLEGMATSRARRVTRLVVPTPDGVYVVPVGSLTTTDVAGIDPEAGMVSVAGEVHVEQLEVLPSVGLARAVGLGQVALAFELVGSSRAMLDLARDHALTRVQFGRPIASFQAVRHRLADALVAIEAAYAATAAAAERIGAAGEPDPVHAAMAKALAGSAARSAARHCQQVLAGIGFTAEHGFHHHLRRVLLLDELLGSSRVLTRSLGRRALEEGRVPFELPL